MFTQLFETRLLLEQDTSKVALLRRVQSRYTRDNLLENKIGES